MQETEGGNKRHSCSNREGQGKRGAQGTGQGTGPGGHPPYCPVTLVHVSICRMVLSYWHLSLWRKKNVSSRRTRGREREQDVWGWGHGARAVGARTRDEYHVPPASPQRLFAAATFPALTCCMCGQSSPRSADELSCRLTTVRVGSRSSSRKETRLSRGRSPSPSLPRAARPSSGLLSQGCMTCGRGDERIMARAVSAGNDKPRRQGQRPGVNRRSTEHEEENNKGPQRENNEGPQRIQ